MNIQDVLPKMSVMGEPSCDQCQCSNTRSMPDGGQDRMIKVGKVVLVQAAKLALTQYYEGEQKGVDAITKVVLEQVVNGDAISDVDDVFEVLPDWLASEHVKKYTDQAVEYLIENHGEIIDDIKSANNSTIS